MSVHVLLCDTNSPRDLPPDMPVHRLPVIPSRTDLAFLSDLATAALPNDDTPSLEEIAMRPDVGHLGAPSLSPQKPVEPVRLIVAGTDASLSAVLTFLMRKDHLWFEIAYLPDDDHNSPAAQNWGIPTHPQDQLTLALTGDVHPVPLIRDDKGVAVAGMATVTEWDNREFTGEIVVDDDVLLNNEAKRKIPKKGLFGARLVPMTDAPGIAAVLCDTPAKKPIIDNNFFTALFGRRKPRHAQCGTVDPSTLLTGRALQAGGIHIAVTIDGVLRPRPAKAVTFYRHLRDAQIVR